MRRCCFQIIYVFVVSRFMKFVGEVTTRVTFLEVVNLLRGERRAVSLKFSLESKSDLLVRFTVTTRRTCSLAAISASTGICNAVRPVTFSSD